MTDAMIQVVNAVSPVLTQVEEEEEVKQEIPVQPPTELEEEKQSDSEDDKRQAIVCKEIYKRHCIGDDE